jgi:amidase
VTDFGEYREYDGLGLAELVRTRQVKPSELVEEAIDRIETLNPTLNAVIHKMYEPAREAVKGDMADGPFAGVPFLLKDVGRACAGAPLRNGSRFYRDYVPDHDCEMVKRFRAAGVVIVGKTNVPEYGLMPVTEPALFGPTNNPWDLTRTPGGSSGGSAAAVAAGMVPLAHGSDGGGSIRIPAACCGLFGLKPTRGRNPLGPDVGEAWHGLACDHVLTRSVRDSAAMLDATAGPDAGAPYYAVPPPRPFLAEVGTDPGRLRIASTWEPVFPAVVHPDCVRALESTVELCRDLGHEVVEAALPVDGRSLARDFLTVIFVSTRAAMEQAEVLLGRKATFRDFEPETWASLLLAKRATSSEFSRAIQSLQRGSRQIGRFLEEYDVLLTPTVSSPPLVTGTLQTKGIRAVAMKLLGRLNAARLLDAVSGIEALADHVYEFMPYTPVANITGQPAMTVPLCWNDEGLPMGMHFAGRYGDEATLFRLAGQLEKARPWFDHLPPSRAGA